MLKLFPIKFKSRWFGSFTITKNSPHKAIECKNEITGGTLKVNGHRLKHYYGREDVGFTNMVSLQVISKLDCQAMDVKKILNERHLMGGIPTF